MKNFDNLTDFTYFATIDEMPEDFTGNFGIPTRTELRKFYNKYPKYWTEFEHKGTVKEGVLTVDGEPLPAITLKTKYAPENP